MSSFAGSFVINSANTMINGSGALLTLSNANGTVNVKGGLTVNAIGGTTVASTVKLKKYSKITNFSVPAGSPTVPTNLGTTVAITGFTATDVPYPIVM